MCLHRAEMALFSYVFWPDERKDLAMTCLREEALDRLACVFADLKKNHVCSYDDELIRLKRHFSVDDIQNLFDILLNDAAVRDLALEKKLVVYRSEIANMIQDINKKFT